MMMVMKYSIKKNVVEKVEEGKQHRRRGKGGGGQGGR